MSWTSRLMKLKQNDVPSHNDLEPVFISGSRFIKNILIEHLSTKYPWADISNVSLSRLKKKYNNNYDKIISYLKNNRYDSKIYKHCTIDLMLIQTVNDYNIRKTPITTTLLTEIFNKCSKLICSYDLDTAKTVFILDYRRSYFYAHFEYIFELILYSAAALALISKKHLFPFIEFIVLSDDDIEPKNRIFNDDDGYILKLISHLQQSLNIVMPPLKSAYDLDINHAVKLIINAHATTEIIELELF